MSKEKLNLDFDIPLEQLEDRIKTKMNGRGHNRVIPPRALEEITDISLIPEHVIKALIHNIPLLHKKSGERVFQYEDSEIKIYRRSPKGFFIGQTFISTKKLLSIMFNFENKLERFNIEGVSKMPPYIFHGSDINGEQALGIYLPTIIEIQEANAVLLDGIHRSFNCKSAGTTINAIHINYVKLPLPFDIIEWDGCSPLDHKPPKAERYLNLKKELYRDLGYVGIDG